MVIDSLRVVLFLAGGTAAAAATAYVTGAVDLLFPQPQPRTELAAVPPAANPPAAEPPAVVPAPSDPKPAEPPAVDVKPDLPLPAFDLVRVEPDGSLVIAGTAAPKSRVEVFSEKRVWGSHSATPEGDFAVICEDRLAPGDYAIKIRSITEDGTELISAQTAIVSIPATPDGEVLAMVEEEGRPSKIITAPSAPAEPEKPVEVAVAPVEPEKPAEVVAAPAEPAPAEPEKPAEVVAAPAEPAPAEPEKPAEVAAAPAEPAPAEPEKPAEVVAAPEQPAPAEPENPVEVVAAPAEPEPAEPEKPVEVAAAPAEPEAPEVVTPPAPAVRPVVVVEAVEIEGSRIFIAGKADKGYTVRAYANELLLGDSEVSDGGRFLVEAEQDLPVGHYIMRADLIDARAQVVARAAVPFDREPGEAVAAVAPPAEPAPEPKKPEEVVEAPAPEPRPDVVAEAPRPEPKPEQPAEIAAPAEPEKPAEIAIVEPEKPVEVVTAPPEFKPAEPEKPAEVVEAPAEPAPAEPEKPVEVAAAPAEPEAPEVTQPKLQNVTGAVIIRRGDTLWRISRRVYGKGIRYSTIYVANKPQIADPDRIWPGQVFAVPGESTDGEKADWSAIADQMQQDTPETATR